MKYINLKDSQQKETHYSTVIIILIVVACIIVKLAITNDLLALSITDDKICVNDKTVNKTTTMGIILSGRVFSSDEFLLSRQPLSSCELSLFDNNFNKILYLRTGEDGFYSLHLQPGTKYLVVIEKNGYNSKSLILTTSTVLNKYNKELNFTLEKKNTSKTF